MFYKQPQDQLNAAIELIYPKDWLDQAPQLLSYSSNRELVIHEFIQQSKRSRPQPIQGHLGQLAACLGHHVSESRLKHIESTGIPILIITGNLDLLVNPASSYHIKSKIQHAHLELFHGSGHAIPEEQPERYNRLLVAHFNNKL